MTSEPPLQKVYQKGHTPPLPMLSCRGAAYVTASISDRSPYLLFVVLAVGLVVLMGSSSAGLASLGTPGSALVSRTSVSEGQSFGHGSTGLPTSFVTSSVVVRFVGDYPTVSLTLVNNTSVQATVTLEHILEVGSVTSHRGSGSVGPLGLIAQAFANLGSTTIFNVTVQGDVNSSTGVWVNMSATVGVQALSMPGTSGVPIWQNPNGEIPASAIGAQVGSVQLSLSFHISTAGTVKVGVTVSGWPWLTPTDTLAVEWQYFAPQQTGVQEDSCLDVSASGSPPSTPCGGRAALSEGQAEWTNSSTAVESVLSGSLLSYLCWVNQGDVTTAQGTQSAQIDEAVFPVAGTTLVRLMQVVQGGLGPLSNFSEDPTMALVPPGTSGLFAPLTPLVQGDAWAFLAGTVVALVAVLGGRSIYHRQERERLRHF